jgi:RimJ/RimL family protein N-acetyltransferase
MLLSAIETERLLLRVPTERDVEPWTAMLTDPAVGRFLGPPLADRQAVEAHLARVLERHEADGFGLLAVERKADARVIGRSGFLVWDRRSWRPTTLREAGDASEIEIGWTLARDCWGLGYATEAGAACRDAGFAQLGRDRIAAIIQPENERSQAVAQRLGMAPAEDIRTASGFDARVWVVSARTFHPK